MLPEKKSKMTLEILRKMRNTGAPKLMEDVKLDIGEPAGDDMDLGGGLQQESGLDILQPIQKKKKPKLQTSSDY